MTLMNSRLLAARAGVMTLVKTALFSGGYTAMDIPHNTTWEIR